jgi:hypothetical protein
MTTYKSAVSAWLFLPIAAILSVVAVLMAVQQIWPAFILTILMAAFIVHMLLTTYYQIEGNTLTVKCGFLVNQEVKIDTIRKIKETSNPLSAPAASLDRLEIGYNKYDTVMISPKDKAGFIKELTGLNPGIEVRLKNTNISTVK